MPSVLLIFDLLASLFMDDTIASPGTKLTTQVTSVRATQLLNAFESYAPLIKVLSLDCFDTILLRKTATPIDVFYNMQRHPAFQALGLSATIRARAETLTRVMNLLKHQKGDVTLAEIYQTCFPHSNQEQIKELETAELEAEVEACYAFPPIIELIRKAHDKKLKIIIVSDTYLKHDQLKYLLSKKLPADVFSYIDTIFCSCEYGRSKTNGLFNDVLKKIHQQPHSILHVGDNPMADLLSARNMKLHALHLVHHDENNEELLRLNTTAASLMDTSIRYTRGLSSLFRGVFAASESFANTPEQQLGYGTLGPIMYAFAHFICDEATRLKNMGKQVKVLFLLRDAYLPSLACETIGGSDIGKRVRISRFSSHAAAFRSRDDVLQYLGEMVLSYRFVDMAKQLLLPEEVANSLITVTMRAPDPVTKFVELIQQKDILQMIIDNSTAYRKRLIQYLKKTANIETGDTLMLVDLGYSGTTQRLLEPVFREELNIEIIGRYLIALNVIGGNQTRRGLLDPSWCDHRALHTLVAYIALLEQLCTTSEASVIDYSEEGEPIFAETSLTQQQHNKLELIQAECLRFVKAAKTFFMASGTDIPRQLLQDAAMENICRLLFLPTQTEINYLESFQFELNLGTKDTFSILDPAKGLSGLRRRGVFSLFMEKNASTLRTNTPAEMRAAGIELALTLFAQHRFTLEFKLPDLNFRKESINIIVVNNDKSSMATLEASLTYDGYYSMTIPVGTGEFKIGVLFGQKYRWVQLHSVELIVTQAYLKNTETQFIEDAWPYVVFNQMDNKGEKLFECVTDNSLMMLDTPHKPGSNSYVARIVFRPLVAR